MMRLIQVCLPLALVAALAAGQQTQRKPSESQRTDTSTTRETSQVTRKRVTGHRATRARHAKKSTRKAQKRPEYTSNAVEVINGSDTRRVAFESPESANDQSKNGQGPLKVEVVNGTATDTRYFYNNGQEQSAEVRNRPVVIGIQSSDTRVVGGNKNPVVKGITSVEGEAKSGMNSDKRLNVSPRPKRPAYQPDVH